MSESDDRYEEDLEAQRDDFEYRYHLEAGKVQQLKRENRELMQNAAPHTYRHNEQLIAENRELREAASRVKITMSKMWDAMCREKLNSYDEMIGFLSDHLPELGFTDCFGRSALDRLTEAERLLREVVGTMTDEAKELMPTYVYLPLRAFLNQKEEI